MKILDAYHGVEDLKNLNHQQLEELAKEIRELLIDLSKKKEIHLSSNLGIVEITMAILLQFDLTQDVVLYDTGHQSYVHKILTDRKDRIASIREDNGLSGLLDMHESKYDHYSPGHSGNAISVLDGMYQKIADENKNPMRKEYYNKKFHVVVVGDAAITNGISFEALNDVGNAQDPLIIIVNDNGMSISKAVGTFAKSLNNIKSSASFFRIEKLTRKIFKFNKSYYRIYNFYKHLETRIVKPNIFQNLNFEYVGPVDGHNLKKVIHAIEKAKWYSHQGPVILHIKTNKGKGYSPAEQDYIGNYHSNVLKAKPTFGQVAYENLNDKIKTDPKLRILNPAMNVGSGFNDMLLRHEKHYQDTGINEEHTVSKASGMALKGLKVYNLFYSSFLQRSYDQLVHDLSRLNLNITFLLDRADLSGGDGPSHHGIFDVGFLKSMPHTTITSPRNFQQLNQLIDYSYSGEHGIFVIRYPKAPFINESLNTDYVVQPRTWEFLLRNKHSTVVLTYGPYADVIAKTIQDRGLACDLVVATWINNYEESQIQKLFADYTKIICYERIYGTSGLLSDLYAYKSNNQLNHQIIGLHYEGFVGSGSTKQMDQNNGMDIERIIKLINE